MTKKIKTFTLIEMLIVIVIIGILAAALVPRLNDVQSRARDTKRKTDLRNIYNANEIYFLDNGVYPRGGCAYGAACRINSTITATWMSQLSGVMTSIPVDPINNAGDAFYTGNYAYSYGWHFNSPTHTYDLIAQLENKLDPDRCGAKGYRYFNDAAARCFAFGGSFHNNIYDLSPNIKNTP